MDGKNKTLRIMLPHHIGGGYDYLPHPEEKTDAGAIVQVPFGARREIIGVVWGDGTGDIAPEKLKTIRAHIPIPPLPEVTRKFIDWVAHYTLSPPGQVLKMALPGEKVIIAKAKDVFSSPPPNPDYHQPALTAEQKTASDFLIQQIKKKSFTTTLLDGITGSGKTEVYCEAIAEILRRGGQALILLPEIAMTAGLLHRFEARFGTMPTLWHSALTEKQRRIHWQAIATGKARLILGARSALFLPYPNLNIIVVDEEHEASYKQEEGTIYHARDMAVVRASLGNIPIILSSATPSLETLYNVQQKKYDHIKLRSRYGEAGLPKIELIDLRKENLNSQSFISPRLVEEVQKTITAGGQAMLFLNRRGYAPLTLCRACGHRLQCPHCTSWMIEHKHSTRLHCHHCNHSMPLPQKCPSCEVAGKLAACGPGVERIEEEIKTLLPHARTAIMASDVIQDMDSAQNLVKQMGEKSLDILIGTQIMAKGYHFPRLTLVGVIDADLGLSGGDPRASERTFHLLQQMAGRSGRASEAGLVLLQTTTPEHPVMRALQKGDQESFMETELRERQKYHLPPFARLASLTISGRDQRAVGAFAHKLASLAPQNPQIRILGPAPAVFAILRGNHRQRLLLIAPRNIDLSKLLRGWLGKIEVPKTLRLLIDIDPYSFM